MIQETQRMLKFLREKGYNVTDIAYQVGVREQAIYRWARGISVPHKSFFAQLRKLVETLPNNVNNNSINVNNNN